MIILPNFKLICFLLGRALFAFSFVCFFPIIYAVDSHNFDSLLPFACLFFLSFAVAFLFNYAAKGHKRRVSLFDSAFVLIAIWLLLAFFASLPFIFTLWLSPIDAFLEAVSDLTAAPVDFLPFDAPFILHLWQASLMWLGSFIFLACLVALLPLFDDSFALFLSISPMIGQMRFLFKKIFFVYAFLSAASFLLFVFAGLDFWHALFMAMRSLSTGSADSLTNSNILCAQFVVMLFACGNFFSYCRFNSSFATSELIFFALSFFSASFIIAFNSESFSQALFVVLSFISTTSRGCVDITNLSDFNRYLLVLLSTIGGCMGSLTGGLKIFRIIVLFKLAAFEVLKTLHPRMLSIIKVNSLAVPTKIAACICTFFFMFIVFLFFGSVLLSLSGIPFSKAVAMTLACLTNITFLPGLCDSSDFFALPPILKLFSCFLFVAARIDFFPVVIFFPVILSHNVKHNW